ncbi:MAG: hypothetical protein F7C33_03460 [Desulfurococcales archaeon]|nr:hypothetical protein [Desulfurococcales archaeon]
MAAKCVPVPLAGERVNLEKPVHEVLVSRYSDLGARLTTREGLLLGREEESRELRGFLESVLEAWERKLKGERVTSRIAYIIGEWGMGKTAFADYAERLCRKMGLTCVNQTFDHVRAELSKGSLWEYRDKPRLLLERLVELLVGDRSLLERREPIVVIVDEMEAIATPGGGEDPLANMIVDQFLQLYKALVDPRVGEEDELFESLRGRLHLILLLTPEAHMRLNNKISLLLGQEGRYERRPDKKIRLKPFPKEEFLELLDIYTSTTLGVSIREVLGDPRLVNTLYLLTSGAPGIALDLLRQLLEKAIGDCTSRPPCLCRITPLRFLEYIGSITIVGEEGRSLNLVKEEFLKGLLEHLSSDEEALAIAAASHVAPGETGKRIQALLEALGISLVEAVAAPLSRDTRGAMAREVLSELVYAECGGRADCEQSLSSMLEYFKHYNRGWGLVLVLPTSYTVFREWIRYLGGNVGRIRPEEYKSIVEKLLVIPGSEQVLIPTPESLTKVYILHGIHSLPYVIDRLKAREIMNKVLSLEVEKPWEFNNYASIGLAAMIAMGEKTWLSENGWQPGDRLLILTLDYNGVNYPVPIEVRVQGEDEEPGDLCSAREVKGILVFTVTPSVKAKIPCRRVKLVHASPRVLRKAVALGILISSGDFQDLVDQSLLEEDSRSVVQDLSLEAVIRGVVEGLAEDGFLVALDPEARSLLYELVPKSIKYREYAALDIYKFLLTYGSGRESTVDWLLESLTRLLSILPYKDTPDVRVPELSSTDLRDYGEDSLRRLIEGSLRYLARLGLVEGRATLWGSVIYRPVVPRDPLSRRLVNLLSAGEAEGKTLLEVAEEYFILPQDPANREEARRRILTSFNALLQHGLVSFRGSEKVCRDFNCKVEERQRLEGVEVRDLAPKYEVNASKIFNAKRGLSDAIARASRIYERLGMEDGGRLGDLLVCKAKKCMVTGVSRAGAFLDEAWRIGSVHDWRVPLPARHLISILESISSSLARASSAVFDEVEDGLNRVDGFIADSAARLRELLNNIIGRLADYPDNIMAEISRITGQARQTINRLLDAYKAEVHRIIKERFAEADALIECHEDPEKRGRKTCKQILESFREKRHLYTIESRFRGARRRLADYSPHLQAYREIAGTVEEKLGELEDKATGLEKRIEKLLNTIDIIGENIRAEAAGLLRKAADTLEHATTIDALEKELDNVNTALKAIAVRSDRIRRAKEEYLLSKETLEESLKKAIPSLRQKIISLHSGVEEILNLGGREDRFLEKYKNEARNIEETLRETLASLEDLETRLKNTAVNLEQHYKKMTTAREPEELDERISFIEELARETQNMARQITQLDHRIGEAERKLEETRKRALHELERRTKSLAREDLATIQAIALQSTSLPKEKLELLTHTARELEKIQELVSRRGITLEEAYNLYKKALGEIEKALEALGPETTRTLRLLQELTRKTTITYDELVETVKNYYPGLEGRSLLEKIAETLELLERRGFRVIITLY